MTLPEIRTTTVEDALVELIDRGYILSVETQVVVYDHKVGAHSITYADQLRVTGPERVPNHLREAVVANKPLFLAAASVLDPPTTWLAGLVWRCKSSGAAAPTEAAASRKGTEYRITPNVLAANIAGFVGLDSITDAPRITPVVRAALRASRLRGRGTRLVPSAGGLR